MEERIGYSFIGTIFIILLTDGQSNGSVDVITVANELKKQGTTIFVIGVADIKEEELYAVASSKNHVYILRTLEDISNFTINLIFDNTNLWDANENRTLCDETCLKRHDCCDTDAECRCGSQIGHHECVCNPGFEGQGAKGFCSPCPMGTFKDKPGNTLCETCPAFSTSFVEGSTNSNNCTCLEGYEGQPEDGKPCSVIHCDDLILPTGTRTIPAKCDNAYGSLCLFRCQPGYCPGSCDDFNFARSASYKPWHVAFERSCLSTGKWTGSDLHCEKVQCKALNDLRHGHYNCEDNFNFGSVCTAFCGEGYTLIGSSSRQCLENGSWSGTQAMCQGNTCPPLKTNEKLYIAPVFCGSHASEYNSICIYHCQTGYKLVTNDSNGKIIAERQCLPNGTWSSKQDLWCEDDELPIIECPASIERNTDPGKPTAVIDWNVTSFTDNVGVKTVRIISPESIKKPPYAFPIGTTEIIYEVEDSSGLSNHCSFTVTVTDIEPPRIISCPTDVDKIFWKPPVFSDNSGSSLVVHTNWDRRSLLAELGHPVRVTYNASDPSGNTAVCSFFIKLKWTKNSCPYTAPPANGYVHCDSWGDDDSCKVYCNPGYNFVFPPERYYLCSQLTNQWSTPSIHNPLSFPWPDCAKIGKLDGLNVTGIINYKVTNCFEDDIAIVKAEFKDIIKTQGLEHWVQDIEISCSLRSPRGKRSQQHTFTGQFPVSSKYILTLSYDLKIKTLPGSSKSIFMNTTYDEPLKAAHISSKTAKKELEKVIKDKYKSHSPTEASFTFNKHILCKQGEIPVNKDCLSCPIGTYFELSMCKNCPVDFYQDKEASLKCKRCPLNKHTLSEKTVALEDCRSSCAPGTFSDTSLEPCIACPRGTYSDITGGKNCTVCPHNMTTTFIGSKYISSCVFPCSPGFYSTDGFPPCIPCPKGTYQSESKSKFCVSCPGSNTTKEEKSSSIKDCQTFNWCEEEPCSNGSTCVNMKNDYECICLQGFAGKNCDANINDCDFQTCLNNGTCVDGINNFTCDCPLGFSGSRCEMDDDDCASGLCHGGICEDLVHDYKCHCPDGLLGKNCELNVDDCNSNPCMNNGRCFDLINDFKCYCPSGFTGRLCELKIDNCEHVKCLNGGSCDVLLNTFNCVCAPGFEGTFCENNVDDCLPNQCKNGGTCIDGINNATCLCSDLFTGDDCGKELPIEFIIEFPLPVTPNYVKLQNVKHLFAFTISFFMQTSYIENNIGTPLSYGFFDPKENKFQDNGITLMNPSSLMIYLHGELFHTGYVANKDMEWHHYCLTWENTAGYWALYVDGSVIVGGSQVAKGKLLYPGIFILGQDQDAVGSDFSIRESFVGNISEFNVYDYAFTSREVRTLASKCFFHGNHIKWPVVQKHLHGDLKLHYNFDLCQKIGECSRVSCHCKNSELSFITDHMCKGLVKKCNAPFCENSQPCFETRIISFCNCSDGYDGRRCEIDIDECMIDNGKCSDLCHNTIGSYFCSCPGGKKLLSDRHTCTEATVCKVENFIYENGENWTTSCQDCFCDLGSVICKNKTCVNMMCDMGEESVTLPGNCCPVCLAVASCTVHHMNNVLTTFYEDSYRFLEKCLYALTENHVTGEFAIHVQTEDKSRRKLCKRSVDIYILDQKLSISSLGTITLNDQNIAVPYEDHIFQIKVGNPINFAVQTLLGVSLDWTCPGYIKVSVPLASKWQLSGLCSNFKGKHKDDLITAKLNSSSNSIAEFIESFKRDSQNECVEHHLNGIVTTSAKKHGFEVKQQPSH